MDPEEDLEKDEDLIAQLRSEMEKEKEHISSASLASEEKKDYQHEEEQKKENEKTIEMMAAENVARALAVENAKLKAELSAFDREFFEELEDLKLKYSELQTSQQLGSSLSPPSPSSSPQRQKAPLSPRTIGRLGQSTRRSLKAMSRSSQPLALSGRYDMSESLPGRLSTSLSPQRNRRNGNGKSKSKSSNFNRKSRTKPRMNFAWSLQTAPRPALASASASISLGNSLSESLGRGSGPGTGTGESFGSLCERRLQFALQNHLDPMRATKTLLHEISALAHSERCKGFILPSDLHTILTQLNLSLSLKEVELLCSGFASNGEGAVDALELGRVIQTMLYQSHGRKGEAEGEEEDDEALLEETLERLLETVARDVMKSSQYKPDIQDIHRQLKLHHQQQQQPKGKAKARAKGKLQQEEEEEEKQEEELQKVLGKVYLQLEQLLLDPFCAVDEEEEGVLERQEFMRLLHGLSFTLSAEEIKFLSQYYASPEDQDDQDKEDSPKEKREEILYPDFVQDLCHSLTELLLNGGDTKTLRLGAALGSGGRGGEESGDGIEGTMSWLLYEFDLIDELLNQLEDMKPSLRRKILTQLQANLTQQLSGEGEGVLDGTVVLKALITVGFQIPRDMRIKFLNHIDSASSASASPYGATFASGCLNSYDLCAILSASCLPWASQERGVFGKILKTMGVTCAQRWQWWHRLKRDLLSSDRDSRLRRQQQKQTQSQGQRQRQGQKTQSQSQRHRQQQQSKSKSNPLGLSWKITEEREPSDWDADEDDDEEEEVGWGQERLSGDRERGGERTIPASLFLHCLRENGVALEIEEEAVLLDCLDFETQANALYHGYGPSGLASVSSPEVSYQSFLSLCAQFIGRWYDTAPEIQEQLKRSMLTMLPKAKAKATASAEGVLEQSIKELETLFRAFDDSSSSSGEAVIEFRPFLVSCHRSRLLSSLEPTMAEELGKLLIEEREGQRLEEGLEEGQGQQGAGKIRYMSFVFYLKDLATEVLRTQERGERGGEGEGICEQLLRHGTEPLSGTLKPIREYLRQLQLLSQQYATQQQTRRQRQTAAAPVAVCETLSSEDLSELLREFSVVYHPQGQELETFLASCCSCSSSAHFIPTLQHQTPYRTQQLPTVCGVLHVLQQHRGTTGSSSNNNNNRGTGRGLSWTQRQPQLAKKFRQLLSRMTSQHIAKLFTRLQAFAFAHSGDRVDGTTLQQRPRQRQRQWQGQMSRRFVSGEVLRVILSRCCGLSLSEQEMYFLCDECDTQPFPGMVRISILLEALLDQPESAQGRGATGRGGIQRQIQDISRALSVSHPSSDSRTQSSSNQRDSVLAVEHLRELLWNSALALNRSPLEWQSDVLTLLDGFDCGAGPGGGTGVVRTDDFVLALSLLSVPRLSQDLLHSLPCLSSASSPSSSGFDLIPYRLLLLHTVFPTDTDTLTLSTTHTATTTATHFNPHSNTTNGGDRERDAVGTLVRQVRKSLNLFLSQQSDLEQAWASLLTVFTKFDPQHSNAISARDFLLAVSVLMSGDSPVLSRQQWQEIVLHFRAAHDSVRTGAGTGTGAGRGVGMCVDYLAFLDAVLDSSSASGRGRDKDRGGSPHPRDTLSSSLRKLRWDSQDTQTATQAQTYTATSHGLQSRLASAASSGALVSSAPRGVNSQSRSGSRGRTTQQPPRRAWGSSSSSLSPTRGKKTVTMSSSDREPWEGEDHPYGYSSSTISGRGVVGHSYGSSSNRTPTIATASNRYASASTAASGLSRSLSASATAEAPLSSSQLRFLSEFDTFTVKEFNSELYDALSLKLGLSSSLSSPSPLSEATGETRRKLLQRYLEMEDKNHSGTLSRHSLLAGLNALGVSHSFWSKPLQRLLVDKLVELGPGVGEVAIKDVMKLILFQ